MLTSRGINITHTLTGVATTHELNETLQTFVDSQLALFPLTTHYRVGSKGNRLKENKIETELKNTGTVGSGSVVDQTLQGPNLKTERFR